MIAAKLFSDRALSSFFWALLTFTVEDGAIRMEVVWAPLLLLDEVIVEVAIVFVPVVSTFMSLQEAS